MEKSILATVVLPIAIALIMFGMGLSLTLADFKRIGKLPKAVFLGVFNQLILLPLVAFLFIHLFGLTGGLAVGLVVIAVCPGGATSNIITHVSKGDTALSVTLTAISSIVTVFTIPFVLSYALDRFMGSSTSVSLPIDKTFGALFLITLIPIGLGMLVKHYKNNFALKADKPVRIASIVIFVVLVLGIILKEKAHIVEYFAEAGIVALSLNIATMLLGFFSSKLLKLNSQQSVTISIESGLQNGTLAIAVVALIPQEVFTSEMFIFPAVYSIVMFFTGGFMMGYFGRKKA